MEDERGKVASDDVGSNQSVGTRRLSSSNQLRMRLIGVLFGCGVQFPDLLNE